MRSLASLFLLVALTAACGGDDGESADVDVPDGFDIEVVLDGLRQPTQLTVLDDGRFLVAQLNGGETAGTGQVVIVDPDGSTEVLYDGLDKPTGVTVVGEDLWVMERRRLSRGALDGGELETVFDEMPYNGRSESTLTPTPDGRLLYATSGTIVGGAAQDGSGVLWTLAAAGDEPTVVATGLKNAYAHTFGADGTLWVTEIADGSFDGSPAPDELVRVEVGDDFGWPACVGDNRAVEEFGGTDARCADAPRSHALFEIGSTATSVAVAPWDPETLLVSLWNAGEVVAVPVDGSTPIEPTTFLRGIDNPQHLVADGDRLLVVDFAGRVLAVERAT